MPSRTSKSTASLRAPSRLALIALAAALAWAAPAHASEVIVVGATGAERVEDPFVPSRAETDLGPGARAAPRIRAVELGQRREGGGPRPAQGEDHPLAAGLLSPHLRPRPIHAAQAPGRPPDRARVRGPVARGHRGRGPAQRPRACPRCSSSCAATAPTGPPSRSRPSGDQISFRGSELLYQYFPGRGLQLHPLSNFKKANLLHGACADGGGRAGKPVCGARPPGPKKGTPCRPGRLRRLLDELSALAVRRGKFIAWEYNFHFGGGSPPWMSGMAQSVAVVALGRAARTLKRPDYNVTAHNALGAFSTRRPTGVRTRGPMGGVHYLQYSFSPRLFIFNAFFQSLIGLYDYGRLAKDPVATKLFEQAEPEARREVPYSDVGDWSRYSFRGRESTHEYHELLREVLQGLGRRLGLTGVYCLRAIRYRGYQTDPPKLTLRLPAAGAAQADDAGALQPVEAVGRGAADLQGPPDGVQEARHVPPRVPRLRLAAEVGRGLPGADRGEGAAHGALAAGRATTAR